MRPQVLWARTEAHATRGQEAREAGDRRACSRHMEEAATACRRMETTMLRAWRADHPDWLQQQP